MRESRQHNEIFKLMVFENAQIKEILRIRYVDDKISSRYPEHRNGHVVLENKVSRM